MYIHVVVSIYALVCVAISSLYVCMYVCMYSCVCIKIMANQVRVNGRLL